MAKSPVNNPPAAEVKTGAETVPNLVIENANSVSTASGNEAVPQFDPPFSQSGSSEEGFGAGVWNNDKRTNALFSANETRNSWMSVVGVGWVKMASTIDSANEALTIFSTAAKVKNSPINYLLDGGQVIQLYVW